MENSSTTLVDDMEIGKRDSFAGRVWKQLRESTRRRKAQPFVSYCPNEASSEAGETYISEPTNFHRRELSRENFTLENTPIQECPFDVSGYGKLLLKNKLKLRKPKRKRLMVFLFEKIIILTTDMKKEDIYYYYASIKISNLALDPISKNKKIILLKDFTYNKFSKNDIEYKLEAKTEEIQNMWRQTIEKCLWMQLLSVKDQQNCYVND